MIHIVCLGELLIDMFPAEMGRRIAEVSAFMPKPGGAPANAAVAAARLGARSAFVGKVGDEAFGRHLAEVLASEGVDTRGVRFDPDARTTMAFIAKPDENTQEFVFYRNPGADTRLRPDELDETMLQSTRVLHFGSLSLSAEPIRSATWRAVRLAKEVGALISFDVNFRPTLWDSPVEALEQVTAMIPQADLVKLNEVELELVAAGFKAPTNWEAAVAEAALEGPAFDVVDRGPKLVVITLGPNGSYYRTAEGGRYLPPFRVKTVDATGCGDAFIAGLLWQLIKEGDWRDRLNPEALSGALRYGNAVGAITAQTMGVIPALPTAGQVDAFLRKRH